MLDLTDPNVTSEDIWQDVLQEKLLDVIAHLDNPNIMPGGQRIDLQYIVKLPGKKALFNVIASGRSHPLSFTFKVAAAGGEPFCAMPVDPDFFMTNNPVPEGYTLHNIDYDLSATWFAADVLVNYQGKLNDPRFDPTDPRIWRLKDKVPRMH
jgi:hypothetical protein